MKAQTVNRKVWNDRVLAGTSDYTQPVSSAQVAAARRGDWAIHLTPVKAVPEAWFGEVKGADVLCLASGGGQQGPVLAAGATVTVFDLSDEQLGQDVFVAGRDQLTLRTVQGDMTDLSVFADGSFDLIVHPVSNCFIPDTEPLWTEAFRVLRPGGALLAGMVNPLLYALDDDHEAGKERLALRHKIPYSDVVRLTAAGKTPEEGRSLEFGHTLDDLIGGQLGAGFVLTGFYEDRFPGKPADDYIATLFATRAIKPR